MTPALSLLPTPDRPAAIEPVDDTYVMLLLWQRRRVSPACRDAALGIADLNLANSRKVSDDRR